VAATEPSGEPFGALGLGLDSGKSSLGDLLLDAAPVELGEDRRVGGTALSQAARALDRDALVVEIARFGCSDQGIRTRSGVEARSDEPLLELRRREIAARESVHDGRERIVGHG